MPNHLSKIKGNVDAFSQRELKDLNPVFAPTERQIIDLIDKYWMSRFDRGDFDKHGQKRPFFNIIETPVFVAGKMLDIDTKDPKITPVNGSSPEKAQFFQRELSMWMMQSGLSKLLNKIKWMLPKYGSVVVKRTKDREGNVSLDFVPLQNLDHDVKAKTLDNSHFIAEKHEWTPRELRNKPYDKDRIERVINKVDDEVITVYEYFGTDIDDSSNNFFVVAQDGTRDGTVLAERELSDHPYYELHWDKVPGRWLGAGLVEKNFEAQIHLNRVQYLKSNGLHWTSKHIYQTQDDNISKNMLVDVEDGQVIRTRRNIEPIVNEERNLAAYQEEENVWMNNVNKRSFSTDVLRGQRPPSGTPLGSVTLAAEQAGSFFENKREEFGDFIKEILWNDVIPSFKENNNKEHILNIMGSDRRELERFDRMVQRERVNNRIIDYIKDNEEFPMSSQVQMFEAVESDRLENVDERYLKIPEGFYEDLEFDIEITVTGESQDVQAKLNALQTALQTAQSSQERRRLREKMLQLVGIEVDDVDLQQSSPVQVVEEASQRASQPRIRQMNQSPGTANEQTTV